MLLSSLLFPFKLHHIWKSNLVSLMIPGVFPLGCDRHHWVLSFSASIYLSKTWPAFHHCHYENVSPLRHNKIFKCIFLYDFFFFLWGGVEIWLHIDDPFHWLICRFLGTPWFNYLLFLGMMSSIQRSRPKWSKHTCFDRFMYIQW